MTGTAQRDHGGGLDAAALTYGGTRQDWLDLSTGINPVPYPLPDLPLNAWTALPDQTARFRLENAARRFWQVPDSAGLCAVPGASAAIAHIPLLTPPATVRIPGPTYNEHAASFAAAGWQITDDATAASVLVNPNNPDGRRWPADAVAGPLCIIDESFCDVTPDATLMALAARPGTLILKSFGKFWGLAGLRLGFVIGDPDLVRRVSDMLGPWPVAGPALHIGAAALEDVQWADRTRRTLATDAQRLDAMLGSAGVAVIGGTDLFRLYRVDDAQDWQARLARHHIWSRIFPYDRNWLRLGLPGPDGWQRLKDALA